MSQYSELLRAIADGKRLETAYAGAWHPMTEKAAFERMARGDDIEWQESKIVRQVACDVPEPMRVPPKPGQTYYIPNPLDVLLSARFVWTNDGSDNMFFSLGLCYVAKEDAIARARAMLQIESV